MVVGTRRRPTAQATPITASSRRHSARSSCLLDFLDDDALSLVLARCPDEALFEVYSTCGQLKSLASACLAARRTIFLSGRDRNGTYMKNTVFGEYRRQRNPVNGNESYVKVGSGTKAIWRTPTHWLVGLTKDRGRDCPHYADLRVRDSAESLLDVSGKWKVYSADLEEVWLACHVKCLHSDKLAAKLDAAADVIALRAEDPKAKACLYVLGIYEKRAASVNGFPSYVKADDPKTFLYYRSNCWYIGRRLGQPRGKFFGYGLLPEANLRWRAVVPGSPKGSKAPSIRLQCAAGRTAIDAIFAVASPYLALAGHAPEPRLAPVLGVYEKASTMVNGYPSYVSASAPQRRGQQAARMMVWRAGGHWYVGAEEHLGQCKGCFRMATGGGLLLEDACEAGSWSWREASRGDWQEATWLTTLLPHPKPPTPRAALLGTADGDAMSELGYDSDSDSYSYSGDSQESDSVDEDDEESDSDDDVLQQLLGHAQQP